MATKEKWKKWFDANAEWRRTYSREWAARRRALIAEIKLQSGCVDCGYAEHPAALEFDHVRGRKNFQIGHNVGQKWSRLLKEMAKCEIVCANCHAIRTVERRRKGG